MVVCVWILMVDYDRLVDIDVILESVILKFWCWKCGIYLFFLNYI